MARRPLGRTFRRRWPATDSVQSSVPLDERQQGPVIAVRALPDGQLYRLSQFRGTMAERLITVGSSPDADIIVKVRGVSAVHCLLLPRDGETLWIEDYESRYGTRVGRTRVGSEAVEVFPGQLIKLGRKGQLLVCGALLEQCPADLVATDVNTLAKQAYRRYGTYKRAAHMIGVSVRTIRRWITEGRAK